MSFLLTCSHYPFVFLLCAQTKGVLGSDSAAGPPPGAALQQGGPGMAPPFAGQPMPNRPPNMPPMFEGNMPRHPHQQNMGPPGPHPPGPHGPDPMYPPGPGMRPPFAPQEGPPPPMGRSGPSWRPMGPGGAPSGLLPTPAGPTTGPGPGPGGYQVRPGHSLLGIAICYTKSWFCDTFLYVYSRAYKRTSLYSDIAASTTYRDMGL